MDHFVVREDVGPRKAPYLGDAKLVLIPIEVAGFPPIDEAALQRFFSPDDPNGFVQYYETASLGRYRPRVTVTPKVTYASCPLPAAQFPTCEIARGDISAFTAGMDMMREAVKKADEAGFDFAPMDVNGRKGVADGWVDGVMLLTNVPFGGIAFPFAYFNRGDNLNGGTNGPLAPAGLGRDLNRPNMGGRAQAASFSCSSGFAGAGILAMILLMIASELSPSDSAS